MQSSSDVSSLIQDHSKLIERMAYVALTKIRKPSSYDLDDLIQEGNIACIKAINGWDESKGTTITTWINTVLRNHFYDIVWYSYRKVETVGVDDLSPFSQQLVNNTDFSEEGISFLDTLRHRLTPLGNAYIRACLEEKAKERKGFRDRVRARLHINEKAEDLLRDSIKRLFLVEE